MSHLVARLGDLLHFSLLAHKSSAVAMPREAAKATKVHGSPASVVRDDLAFFSLSVEHPVHDRRSDLDRLGLINLGEEPLQEID